jgi:hypothetical protein
MTLSWFCFLADVTLFEQQRRLLSNSSASATSAGAFHSPHAFLANSWSGSSIQHLNGLYNPYEQSVVGADFFSFLENGTFNFTEMDNSTQNFTSDGDENCMGMQQV